MESMNFLKKISYLAAGSIFTTIISMLYFTLITNSVGPEGYGVISIALGFINIAYFAIYSGINESTIKYVAEGKNVTSNSLKLQYILSLAFILVLISSFSFVTKLYNEITAQVLVIYSIALLFAPIIETARANRLGNKDTKSIMYIDLSLKLALLITAAIAV